MAKNGVARQNVGFIRLLLGIIATIIINVIIDTIRSFSSGQGFSLELLFITLRTMLLPLIVLLIYKKIMEEYQNKEDYNKSENEKLNAEIISLKHTMSEEKHKAELNLERKDFELEVTNRQQDLIVSTKNEEIQRLKEENQHLRNEIEIRTKT